MISDKVTREDMWANYFGVTLTCHKNAIGLFPDLQNRVNEIIIENRNCSSLE